MWDRRRLAFLGLLLSLIGLITGWFFYADIRTQSRFANVQDLMRDGRLDEATPLMSECLDARPDSGEMMFWAARLARQKSDFAEAEWRLGLAKKLDWVPEAISLERALIQTQRGQRGFESFLLQCVTKDHPDIIFILEVITPVLYGDYLIDQAFGCGKQWIKLQPDRIAALLIYAKICERLGNPEESRDALEAIIKQNEQHPEARQLLAQNLLAANMPTQAEPLLEALVRERPLHRDSRFQLVKCLRKLGRTDDARTILDALVREFPKDSAILTERGILELEGEHPVEAEKWLRDAATNPPFEGVTLVQLIVCLERNEKRDEVAQRRAELQQLEATLKRFREVTKAISAAPRDVALRREAGQLLLRIHRDDDALRWLTSALELGPGDIETHQTLATYFEKSNPERAKFHRQVAGQK